MADKVFRVRIGRVRLKANSSRAAMFMGYMNPKQPLSVQKWYWRDFRHPVQWPNDVQHGIK